MESEGFRKGQEYYRNSISNGKILETENPYEPDSQNYEDFWDGWVYEEDYVRLQRIRNE